MKRKQIYIQILNGQSFVGHKFILRSFYLFVLRIIIIRATQIVIGNAYHSTNGEFLKFH